MLPYRRNEWQTGRLSDKHRFDVGNTAFCGPPDQPPFRVKNDMKRMTIWDITALIALLSPWIPDLLEIKIRHAILID